MSKLRLVVLCAFVLAATWTLLVCSQPADAITVSLFAAPDGAGSACSQVAPCTLQMALSSGPAGSTIYAAGGRYMGTGFEVIIVTKTVALNGGWDRVSSGPVVTNPNLHESTLDGERQRRVVSISGNITPTLRGFTITGGNATGLVAECDDSDSDGCGGGIFIRDAHPIIANNIISNNVAAVTTSGYPTRTTGYGGGIYASGAARMVITGNVVISNAASLAGDGEGGGIYLRTWANMTGAQVSQNQILSNTATTTSSYSAWGGGIAGGPDGVLIQGNTVAGNRANGIGSGQGAGIFQWYGSALYRGNLVTGNLGGDYGQAILAGYSQSRFEGNRVTDNAVTRGIQLINGVNAGPLLVNNVVAHSGDEAIALVGDARFPLTVTLLNNTVVGPGTGYAVDIETGYVTLLMTNTIVAGHTWGITNTFPASSTILASHTLFWANDYEGVTGESPVRGDPAFAADGYHIGPGSAAVDAGAAVSLADDIDGDSRPNGPAWDIGADEAQLRRVYLPVTWRQ